MLFPVASRAVDAQIQRKTARVIVDRSAKIPMRDADVQEYADNKGAWLFPFIWPIGDPVDRQSLQAAVSFVC